MALNGAGVTTLIDNICNPHDIEYFNGHIYYLMDDGLIKADIDGTGQVNISGAADDAISLTVDGINSRVYWTNFTSVERINLDGTGLTTIFSGVSPLQGIDIGLGTSSHPSRAMPWIPLLLLDTETFSLRSSSFSDGAPIPVQHSLQGGNLSPPLSWNNAPANTQSFVLIMDDPDAPGGTWDHWIVYDIPAGTTSLAEDAGASGDGGLPSGAEHGTNSWGNDYYQGPAPPSGTHRYYFKLYALSVSQLNPSGTNKTAIEAAMTGKILGQTELMGTYTYNP